MKMLIRELNIYDTSSPSKNLVLEYDTSMQNAVTNQMTQIA